MNEYVDNEARKAKLVGKTVTMAHGAGGHQTSELIDMIFKAHFDNPDLTADDAAVRSGLSKCALKIISINSDVWRPPAPCAIVTVFPTNLAFLASLSTYSFILSTSLLFSVCFSYSLPYI